MLRSKCDTCYYPCFRMVLYERPDMPFRDVLVGAVFARGAAPMKLVATSPLAVTAGMRGTFVVATALVVAALVIVLLGKSITDGMRNS